MFIENLKNIITSVSEFVNAEPSFNLPDFLYVKNTPELVWIYIPIIIATFFYMISIKVESDKIEYDDGSSIIEKHDNSSVTK